VVVEVALVVAVHLKMGLDQMGLGLGKAR
jgi:hypothetical protein